MSGLMSELMRHLFRNCNHQTGEDVCGVLLSAGIGVFQKLSSKNEASKWVDLRRVLAKKDLAEGEFLAERPVRETLDELFAFQDGLRIPAVRDEHPCRAVAHQFRAVHQAGTVDTRGAQPDDLIAAGTNLRLPKQI